MLKHLGIGNRDGRLQDDNIMTALICERRFIMGTLEEKLINDINPLEVEEYKDRRFREYPKVRDRRLGNFLADHQLVAMFAISKEDSKIFKFLINQHRTLLRIPEYEALDIRFESTLIDDAAGFYLFQLVSQFRDFVNPIYGSLEYFQINPATAVVTIIYFGDSNPFLGLTTSAKLYKSIRLHLESLAVYLRAVLGIDTESGELIKPFDNPKENITVERKKIALRYIKARYEIYEKSKSESASLFRPPSVKDLQDGLKVIFGIEYSESSIYEIIKQGKEGKI